MTVLFGTAWPISEAVVERLGWVLVHSLWQFALVAILAGIFLRARHRRLAATRYGVLVVAMAVLLTAPVATWLLQPDAAPDWSAGRVPSSPALDLDSAIGRVTDTSPLATNSSMPSDPETAVPTPAQPTANAALGTPRTLMPPGHANNHPTSTWPDRATTALRPLLAWIVAAWGVGVVVCSLRPLLGWHMLWRLRRVGVAPVPADVLAALRRVSQRLGLRRVVRVLQSTLVQVPVVIGYMRPAILLPVSLVTSLPAAQLDAILSHELAHVRRHDFAINLLQILVETIFFYHPAVWWLSRRIRVEREYCCDDLVVRLLGNRVEYGRALLAIEGQRRQNPILAVGAADGSLLARVRRIVGVGSDRDAVSLVGRGPAALFGLTCLGAILAMSMNWNLSAQDEPALKNQPIAPIAEPFGPESDGLRCRLIAVPPTVDDTSPDITKPAKTFARADDVTFAVELKNVSAKPVILLGVRHANGQPAVDGKLFPEFFAPHLFEFEFADADGKLVPRTSRVFIGTYHLLGGVSTHEIATGKSLFVVLRPARFHAPMDHQLPPGSYRAKVRYHGPSAKTLSYFREIYPAGPQVKAWSREVTSNEVAFTVAQDATAPKPAKLVWGAVKDSLQAAVEYRSPPGIVPANDPPGTLPTKAYVSTIFHVKNVADRTITFISETARQLDGVTATNEAGETRQLQGAFFTGEPILVRWTLKPGEVAELHALTAGIGLIDTPGKYTLRYSIDFGSLGQGNGESEFGFPKKDDWRQVLVAGDVPVTIRARTAADDAREKAPATPTPPAAPQSSDATSADPGAGSPAGTSAPPKGLEFLAPYPKLHKLSLDLTEQQFLTIADRQKLKLRKSTDGGNTTYAVATGDGHTVLVMFGSDKCRGIQRVRGEDPPEAQIESYLPDWLKVHYNRGFLASLDDDHNVVSITAGEVMSDELLGKLKTLPRLRELHIETTKQITPAGLKNLAELSFLQKLTVYSLSHSGMGLGDTILQNVIGLKSLRELHLNQCGTTDAGLKLLETMPQLTLLDVCAEPRLTDAAIASIAKLKRLKHLSLNSYVGTEHGWMRFSADALQALVGLRDLEHLHLVGQTVSPQTLNIPQLKSLSLGTASVNDTCADRIAQCRQLQALDLVYTNITDEGMRKIGGLPELRRLNLDSYVVTDAGIKPFAELQKLQHVSLRASRLTDEALRHLAGIKSLTRIDLSGSGEPGANAGMCFTIAGVQRLKVLPNLRTLWLTNVDSAGGFLGLKELTQLHELTLMMTNIRDEEVDMLEAALPNTRIHRATGGYSRVQKVK
jgi:beta-lactamase regulating signal transducer with metallopeptidase domain